MNEMANQEDLLTEALTEIKASAEEFINRRINHINFARTIFWLCVKSRDNKFVYAAELSEFLKVSKARTHEILNDLVSIKLLTKRFPTSNLVEYVFVVDNEFVKIQKYFEQASKTLKIKIKLTKK